MENPEIDSNKYSQLIFDKEAKGIQWSKDSLATNGVRLTGHPHAKKINLDTDITSLSKNHLKMNYRPKCKMKKDKTPRRQHRRISR